MAKKLPPAKISVLTANRATVVAIDEARAHSLAEGLRDTTVSVRSVDTKPYRSSPKAPFMTSTLQQEGGRRLRLSSSQVMRIAKGCTSEASYLHAHRQRDSL